MKEYTLAEDKGHVVSFTEYGNSNGPVILNFHGGPGSGSKPHHAERFDLSKYRVILFDQRGCGKSTPLGETANNTTEDLLRDAERIREQLGVKEWFVAGSSWGATLALLYAIAHPEKVRGLLVSAVFLADQDSMDWGMTNPKGVARLMPDVWAKRMDFFKKFTIGLETQNKDLFDALVKGDLETQKAIVAGINNWEGNLFSVQSAITYKTASDVTEKEIAAAKIFVYYEMNHEFISDNYIIEHVEKIADIPTVIVHGRYDILCPIEKAQLLKDKMKNCELIVMPSSGHLPTAEGEVIRRMAHDQFMERETRA